MRIGEATKVFVLEDSPERIAWFRQRIPQAVVASNAEQALALLNVQPSDAARRGLLLLIGRDPRLCGDAPSLVGFSLLVAALVHQQRHSPNVTVVLYKTQVASPTLKM